MLFVVEAAESTSCDLKVNSKKCLDDSGWKALAEGLSCTIKVISSKGFKKHGSTRSQAFREPLVILLESDFVGIFYTEKFVKACAEGSL